MVVIIMGPSGAGKSTVGRALAESLGWSFRDADDLHSPESVARMRQGIALTDAEREPWLERVRSAILAEAAAGRDAVVACSALRERYRTRLAEGVEDVKFVYLQADPELLRQRLEQRLGHFASVELLDSQLATLEPPGRTLTVDAALPVPALVRLIEDELRLRR